MTRILIFAAIVIATLAVIFAVASYPNAFLM